MSKDFEQDNQRGWHNYSSLDNDYFSRYKEHRYMHKKGMFVKENYKIDSERALNINQLRLYLVFFLTLKKSGALIFPDFFSPYHKEISMDSASKIVDDFINFLSLQSAVIIKTNFLHSFDCDYGFNQAENEYSRLPYFAPDHGSNSATVLIADRFNYLLLTNGED